MRLVFLLFLLLAPLQALAAEPFARATVDDSGDIVPGRQVYVTVDVFAPDFFTSPPQFPLFDLPNALVTLPDERAQNILQTVDGVQYSGIRRRYAVVPEMPGHYVLPPIGIELGYSVDGKPARGVATVPSVSFMVQGSAAIQDRVAFTARNVTMEQSFDRDPASLRAGDALVRTIIITAEDTQAMLIPPLAAGTVSGLRQYTKAPKTEDGVPIGRETASRRTETFVYTATTEGRFSLPEVDYPWFDVEGGEAKSASLPPTQVAVTATPARTGIAPDLRTEMPSNPFERRRHIMLGIGLFLLVAGLLWTGRDLPLIFARYLAAIRSRVLLSRWYRLRRLRRTILSADLPGVYASLQGWSRAEGFPTLDAWARTLHPDLVDDLHGLESELYSARGGDFDRRRAAEIVATSARQVALPQSPYALPELNPGPDTGQARIAPHLRS